MTSIVKAGKEDYKAITDIGRISFKEVHESSTAPGDIDIYIDKNYNYDVLGDELTEPKNIYHLIYHNNEPAGFSKIILNSPTPEISIIKVTKLERIYLLKQFHSLKLGLGLLKFNIVLSQQNHDMGMWLLVWKENLRAIDFYKRNGFIIFGSCDFKLTETHSNPNYQMFLKY